ncbi:hypothetical protein DFP82_11211 [Psychrobacter fozii]|uniref:Uncharacterized protein n=1 Tax=Psychrobacter fozii TaxID=198480 RepID=A0A2V4VCV7_9GAMM|nr:hypothetical protein DFP82_11211 [Psychrobacter fozii]
MLQNAYLKQLVVLATLLKSYEAIENQVVSQNTKPTLA